MGEHRIPYVDRSWSPVTGCSFNCPWCWAAKFSKRLAGRAGYPADDPFRPTFHPDKLSKPLRWRKPQWVATCFMGDLFDPIVPAEWIGAVFEVARSSIRHTFLFLTKQPQRMAQEIGYWFTCSPYSVPVNMWLGVSITNQADADARLPQLAKLAAAGWNTWLSVEPLLGWVDLRLDAVGWVVVGSQSGGQGAFGRHDLAPIRSIVTQCQEGHVRVYVKQVLLHGRLSKIPAEWPEELRIQEFPNQAR